MDSTRAKIEQFFEAYESRTNQALADQPVIDVDGVTSSFAVSFLEASPKGVSAGKNDAEFRKAVPQGLEFYRNIGTKSMHITQKTITQLDDYHWMVKAHWQAKYAQKEGKSDMIDFDVIYFLQILDDQPKIFTYITGDEEQTYKDHGLVPG